MLHSLQKLSLLILLVLSTNALADKPFTIYGFLPYKGYVVGGKLVHGTPPQTYLDDLGIYRVNLIYEERVLDYPVSASGAPDKANGFPNVAKIRELARQAALEPDVPVSLDLEGWDRFKPETPGRFLDVIRIFRSFNDASDLGLYGEVPQFTYGWYPDPRKPDEIRRHDAQNAKYASVASKVSYYSPSLYNDTGDDNLAWSKFAEYNVRAARKYSPDKAVIAYVTAQVGRTPDSGKWLSYDDMMFRLNTLVALGADGCIVWGGSGAVQPNGDGAIIDPSTGWAKALVDFTAAHGDRHEH